MNPNHIPHSGKDIRNTPEFERPMTESEKADGVKSVFLPIAMKALVCCISFVLFVLIECAYFVFTVGILNSEIQTPGEDLAAAIYSNLFIASFVIIALIVVTGVYLLAKLKTEYHICATYAKIYRLVAPIFMIVSEIFVIIAILIFTEAQHYPALAPTFSSIVAICVSMFPILTVWNMNDENRLHNFIDSMSKTFNCVALLIAASAIVIKLIQG